MPGFPLGPSHVGRTAFAVGHRGISSSSVAPSTVRGKTSTKGATKRPSMTVSRVCDMSLSLSVPLSPAFSRLLVAQEYLCLCEGGSLGAVGSTGTIDSPLQTTEVSHFGRHFSRTVVSPQGRSACTRFEAGCFVLHCSWELMLLPTRRARFASGLPFVMVWKSCWYWQSLSLDAHIRSEFIWQVLRQRFCALSIDLGCSIS